jgi:hypothetical protein
VCVWVIFHWTALWGLIPEKNMDQCGVLELGVIARYLSPQKKSLISTITNEMKLSYSYTDVMIEDLRSMEGRKFVI